MSSLRRRPLTQSFYQSSELHEVCDAEESAFLAHDDFRVRSDAIRPLWGHRMDGPVIGLEQKTLAVAVKPLPHAVALLPVEGVKRVRNSHKAH